MSGQEDCIYEIFALPFTAVPARKKIRFHWAFFRNCRYVDFTTLVDDMSQCNGSQISPCCTQWRIPGPNPPVFLDQTEASKDWKKFVWRPPPPSQDLDVPPPLSEGLDPPLVPRYNGHPIIWTAAKSQAKMNYRCLTEINSRYYGLSLFKVPIVPAIKGVDCTSADSQENN